MSATPTAKAQIIAIDDNAAFVDNLAEILVDQGYAVRVGHSRAEALHLAKTPWDVAFMDMRLPDGDGAELALTLTEQCPGSEVIMLTGFATMTSAAAAVRAGASAYLIKPCKTAELLLTLEQALRKVRLFHDARAAARRAQVAEKLAAVGTLTAGLSHEIRNPLNAAVLQLNVLERRIGRLPANLSEDLKGPLTLVRDEIRRLDHTLEDFLQFARPRELARQAVPCELLLKRVADLLARDAENRHLQFERFVEGDMTLAGDEHRLRQVLMNLVLNAFDATPAGGTVRVTMKRESSGQVLISIEDSGPGIPPEVRERIFEPFFTTKASGTGLGLSIVHAIVTQHAGTITLAPSASGTRFEVRLPEWQGAHEPAITTTDRGSQRQR